MLEMVFVLAIALALLGVAAPRLLLTSHRVALTNARYEVTAATAQARAAAVRHGRISYLTVDVALDRLRILVDTSAEGGGPAVEVGTTDLWQELGVNLRASHPVVCFDPRGLSVPSMVCPGAPVTVWIERGGRQDSVVVSTTGMVFP